MKRLSQRHALCAAAAGIIVVMGIARLVGIASARYHQGLLTSARPGRCLQGLANSFEEV